jgi:DNA-binding Lrp family transcriptional regulator
LKKLKSLDLGILAELLKNAKSSDRQIANKLGVSQPTVTRRRGKLERDLDLRYTTVPSWKELGLELIVFTFSRWKHREFPDQRVDEALKFLAGHPNILFVSTGHGLDADRVCVSIHKNYREYFRLMQEFRQQWGKFMENLESFVVSLGADKVLRPLTFEHLTDYVTNEQDEQAEEG